MILSITPESLREAAAPFLASFTQARVNFGRSAAITLGSAALVAQCLSAQAADLPSRVVPPTFVAPEPAYSWTGFYVGINGGYGLDHVPYPYELSTGQRGAGGVFAVTGFSSHGINEHGPIAGGQIGYNSELLRLPIIGPLVRQLPIVGTTPFFVGLLNHLVVGTEFEGDWADINGSDTLNTSVGSAVVGTRIKNFGVLKSRLGYSFDRALVYVFEGESFATTQNYFSTGNIYASNTVTRLPTRLAAYGAGVEYKLTNNWSAKVEYMYDYIDVHAQIFSPTPRVNVVYTSRTTFSTVRAGLNYRFDWEPAPVVARY